MKKVLFIFILAAFVTSCKGKSSWSKAEADAFTTNCVDGATPNLGADKAKSYCDCMLDKVQKKYPKAEDADKLDINAMTDMAKDCMK